jgi:hypothetical protein
MKFCNKCKTSKPLVEFFKRGQGHQPWCKSCKKEHDHKTYKTKPHRRQALKDSTKKYRAAAEAHVVNHLKSNPCPCGETNILTLQFDHLRDKEFEISLAVMQGYSLTRIKSEIEKCQVLCANCHSIKSANQLDSWKLKWLAASDSNRDSID